MCCDSMYVSSNFDGRLKILEVESGSQKVEMTHFVETNWGVTAAEFFSFDQQEFIVLGFENGSLHVYDYSKWKNSNYTKLVF